MQIKELSRYSQKLKEKLEADANVLSLTDDTLSDLLPEDGDYTYLTVYDSVRTEVVKVYKDAGEVLIQRGQNNTTASAFPAGSCVKFEVTGAWIEDFVCNMPDECKPKPLPNECAGDDCC